MVYPEELWLPVREVQDVDADGGVLTVPVVFMSTAGNYRCAAKSEAGSFFADVAVNVERESFFPNLLMCFKFIQE